MFSLNLAPNLPNLLKPYHVLNTLISPGCSIMNSRIRKKNTIFLEPLSCFCNISLNTSILNMQSGWKTIDNKSYNQLLITQDMIENNRQASDEKMKKYCSKSDRKDSKLDNIQQWSKIWCIIIKIRIISQTIWIHYRPRVLPLWYQLTRRIYNQRVEILQ